MSDEKKHNLVVVVVVVVADLNRLSKPTKTEHPGAVASRLRLIFSPLSSFPHFGFGFGFDSRRPSLVRLGWRGSDAVRCPLPAAATRYPLPTEPLQKAQS